MGALATKFGEKCGLVRFGGLSRKARAGWSVFRRPLVTRALPIHMHIEPTSKCNLECPMCLRKEVFGNGRNMDFETFRKIYLQIRPLHITLNGQGEPMMNRDLWQMIEFSEGRGTRVNLTSNGNFLHRFYGEVIDSGLTLLSVSLDSVDPEVYRVVRSRDLLEETLRGLALLRDEKARRGVTRPAVRLSSVMMEKTIDGGRAFLDRAKELGAESVLFQPMALFGKWSNASLVGKYQDRETYHQALVDLDRHAREAGVPTNLQQVIRDFEIVAQLYDRGKDPTNALSKGCLFPWFSLYIRSDGEVMACCVRSYARQSLGNVLREDIRKIWNNEKYLAVRRIFREGKSLPYPECVGCAPPRLTELAEKMKYTPRFMRS
ncbi:MAG: radical SAM protein [Planctomycetes bacterium]|nr:radical SAM protein [Planctomycetota bacterium]